jgi:hypothetical protein
MISAEEVELHLVELRRNVAAFERGGAGAPQLGAIRAHFQLLRERYREGPDAFAGKAEELRALRQRFDAASEQFITAAVDRFHELSLQLRALEAERDGLRAWLIEKAQRSGAQQLVGGAATVRLRPFEALTIPAPRSAEREQLETLLRRSGCWDAVSHLSRPKLQQALGDRALNANLADDVRRMCPVSTIYQVTSRALGVAPG